jgi:3-hydroxyacyl-CoA dehydrogenase
VNMGHLGVKTSKGIYDYKDRSESEILKNRDENFLKMIDYLKDLKAFDPL